MLVQTYSAVVNGLDVTTVIMEVSTAAGSSFHLTGLGDEAVREGRDRVMAAVQNNGYEIPIRDITVNLAPADIRKAGTGFDLPMALALLVATETIQINLDGYMFVGELGLDGRLQPIKGALPIAIQARKEQFKGLIVPKANAREAAVVNRLQVYGMESLGQVIRFLKGEENVEPTLVDTRKEFYSVILGQEARKRLSFVKRFFGFDTFYMDKGGKVTLVEGKYTVAEYSFTEFASLEDMRQYLDKQKKDDAQ